MADAIKNFAFGTVLTAPSPATSGTSLVLDSGQGANFAVGNAVCWPSGVQPLSSNAEIVRITAVATDTLTITRAQEGTTAQSIAVGWQVLQGVTAGLMAQYLALSTVTTSGDLIVGSGAGSVSRLGIGANGDVLTVTAGALGYAAPSTGVDLLQFFQSSLPSSESWTSVAYGNGAFVAIANGSATAAYSTNGGATWTATTLPSSASWTSVAYGNGAFVAVAQGPSTTAAYSTNGGVTWTASTLPSSASWTSVAYGNGAFVAVALGPSTTAAYSTNGGVTWTASTLPSSTSWTSITYGNGAFVAIAQSSSAAAYSTDGGVTWTASTLPSSQFWYSVAYGNGAFVAIANGSATAAYSTNGGATWTATTLPSSASWTSVAYGNGVFVVVAYVSAAAAYSTNGGVTWAASTLPSSANWYSVTYGNGAFVAVAQGPSTAAAYTQVVALASANTATVSNPTVTSGTAFTPSVASNATVYFQINTSTVTAGSYKLTMGPTTGAEHTIGSAVAMLVGSDTLVTLIVPRAWRVVLTLTSVTLGSTTVVAM